MKPRKNKRYEWLVASISEWRSDACLIWPFQKDQDGYGRLRPLYDGTRITVGAHRLAFKLVYGRWPEPCCLHRCDNPPCVNPRHLFEGTDADNHADQVEKGRQTKGERQHDAKLTEEMVIAARVEYAAGRIGFSLLGRKYGISKIAMQWAVTGRTWSHVPGAVKSILSRAPRTHCGRGHSLTPDNLYIYPNGKRYCKQCTAERAKKRKK